MHLLRQALMAAKTGTSTYTSHRSLVLGVGLAAGVIIIALGLPLFLKKVKPNRAYGLVAALRYESRTTWYAANRFLGAALMIAGGVTILGTAVIWLAKPAALSKSNKLLALIELAIIVVPALVAYLMAVARLRR